MLGEIKLRFAEYYFRLNKDNSITFEDLEAESLNINPGDGFMAFVDPNTQEVTLKKFDINNIDYLELTALES